MSGEEYLKALYEVCPPIETAPHMLAPSASTYIYKGKECQKGSDGWRVLVGVQSAKDIPRAGGVLVKLGWLYDYGYIFISKSGAMLPRSIIDAAVWQPERLDFCGGAHCVEPLEQRRPAPEVFNPDAEPFNTMEALRNLSHADEDKVIHAKGAAIREARPESEEVQAKWVSERVEAVLVDIEPADQEAAIERLTDVYSRAAERKILMGDFEVTLSDGTAVSVGEMMDNPGIYHAKRCADPLEPEYNNDHRIGYINLRAAGKAYIWSHAHGGQRFTLHRARETVRLIAGERYETVRKVLELMRINGEHYHRGEIVTITQDGEPIPRDKDGILYDLDGLAKFEKFDKRSGEWFSCDCMHNIATGVQSAKGSWGLPELKGISTAPLIDPETGRLIDADGYDRASGLILILNDQSQWHGIPEELSIITCNNALKRLWMPFKDFPFDGPISRGVWLNAILTAVLRPLLPTAPAISVTAPTAGSGKTLLAKCLAELTGDIPALLPDAGDKDEIRKRLLALLRQGKRILILDNVVGTLDSAALCAMLTAEVYQDRVLGVSETLSVPTRTLVLITGNNITLRGDLCRRVLTCRIDPEMETPWKRAFRLDPVQYCRDHRMDMVRDALTVLRAGLQDGPKMEDRTASFEMWSDSVRRAVCMVAENNLMEGIIFNDPDLINVADPILSVDTAYEMDPETSKLTALISAWWEKWEDKPVKVAQIISEATDQSSWEDGQDYINPELQAACEEIAGQGRNINPRILGRWIEKNRERRIDEKRIVDAGRRQGVRQWRLREGK